MHQATMIPLAAVVIEPRVWPRRQLCQPLVKELAEIYRHGGPNAIEPIVIARVARDGRRVLADGQHRCSAAPMAGLTHLPVTFVDVKSEEEAYELAVRLSSKGPRKMTRAEKQDAIDRLLLSDPGRSDRAIAEIVGVSHPFVARRREALQRPPAEKTPADRPRSGRHATSLIQAAQALDEAVMLELGSRAKGEDGASLLTARLGETLARAAMKRVDGDAGALLARLEAGILAARERL
jgi:ParB-like chromosome segregation protein Spo0J